MLESLQKFAHEVDQRLVSFDIICETVHDLISGDRSLNQVPIDVRDEDELLGGQLSEQLLGNYLRLLHQLAILKHLDQCDEHVGAIKCHCRLEDCVH